MDLTFYPSLVTCLGFLAGVCVVVSTVYLVIGPVSGFQLNLDNLTRILRDSLRFVHQHIFAFVFCFLSWISFLLLLALTSK